MSNHRGPETLKKYFPEDKIYFFFPRWKKFVAARHPNFKLFQKLYADHVRDTLGARDFSSAVSGFCRGFSLRPKMCRPSANTENSRRTREKPLAPRVCERRLTRKRNLSATQELKRHFEVKIFSLPQ